ncbi:MAG: Ig-like domain-containing protein [Oscillospiraceae bacterium]
MQLTATVWPWTVSSGDVTWISEDPSIATVNPRGQVTGVAEGTTTITATSVLDATKFASCTVEVTKLDRELNATVWDQDGKVWWSSFNTGSLPQYAKLTETPANEASCSRDLWRQRQDSTPLPGYLQPDLQSLHRGSGDL